MHQPLYRNPADQSSRTGMVFLPHSTENAVTLQFFVHQPQNITIRLVNLRGGVRHTETLNQFQGWYHEKLQFQVFAPGVHVLQVLFEGNTYYKRLELH